MDGGDTTQVTTAAGAPAGEEDRGYEVTTKPWVVHGGIIAAFAIFISMVMLLFVRWNGSNEPNSSLIFRGTEALAGVEVRLDGPKLDEGVGQKLTKDNGYEVRFSVPGGNYLVRVTKDGQPLAKDSSVTIHEGEGARYELSKSIESVVAQGATTRPG